MKRTPMIRIIIRSIVAVGISLVLLLSGGAPSDFGHGIPLSILSSQ